jgi:hypothetical protein
MEALEELSNDDSVYAVYWFSGYKLDEKTIVESAYRMKRLGEYFKTLTRNSKWNLLHDIRKGDEILAWVLDDDDNEEKICPS